MTLTWAVTGASQCGLTRTYEGESVGSETAVQCTGTRTESPEPPTSASYVEYVLNATDTGGDTATDALRITFTQATYTTRIVSFTVQPLQVGPGDEVTVAWEVINTGTFEGVAPCSLSRRAEFQTAADVTIMSTQCNGSITEVPDAPADASYVRYQLNALKDVFEVGGDPTQAFVYAEETVELLERSFTGDTDWQRQFGTAQHDFVTALAVHASGNITVGGATTGVLEGSNAGVYDAFVRTYDADGGVLWTRQFGSGSHDEVTALAVAGDRVYVLGHTTTGAQDLHSPFLRTYTTGGVYEWETHPTPGDAFRENVYVYDLAVDASGTIYVVGSVSSTAYLTAFDTSGEELWSTYFCQDDTTIACPTLWGASATAVAIDEDGDVYVGGWTTNDLYADNLGSQTDVTSDLFLAKLSAGGSLQWGVQTGSAGSDYVNAIAVSAYGTVAVGGTTSGSIVRNPVGSEDAYLLLRSTVDGSPLWAKQFGSEFSGEDVPGVGFDEYGNVVAASNHSGSRWVDKFYSDGSTVWGRMIGSDPSPGLGTYRVEALAVGAGGSLHAGGSTAQGDFGTHLGENDAFIITLYP